VVACWVPVVQTEAMAILSTESWLSGGSTEFGIGQGQFGDEAAVGGCEIGNSRMVRGSGGGMTSCLLTGGKEVWTNMEFTSIGESACEVN
jgi:hypothetical protein